MIRNIKPVEVSPTIKAARWIFLILGIFYGATKLKAYRIIEEKAKVIRKQHVKEEHLKYLAEQKISTIRDVENLAKDLDIQDLPPGWEEEI